MSAPALETARPASAGGNGGVVVIGGGLAGITAALAVADGGRAVTLLEARPRLGGAAMSFRRGEITVDNGQHIFLRCCTAYRRLLERIGGTGSVHLQDRLHVPVLDPDGRTSTLSRLPGLPAPSHLGASLLNFRLLSVADRARAVRGALAMLRLDPSDAALDRQTFGDFLSRHGQPPTVVDALWGVLATATLNIAPDDASLQLAAKVFRTGLLDTADAADIGHAAVPLGHLHHDLAGAALASAGVDVRLSAHVEGLDFAGVGEPPAVRFRERDTAVTLHPDAVVLAVPHHRLTSVLAPGDRTAAVERVAHLQSSPILNIHVVYDRRVTEHSFAAGVNSPVQWVFDRTDSSGVAAVHPGAQYLAVTVSAADDIVSTPAAELVAQFTTALAQLFPAAGRAEVLDAWVTREKQATFRQAAGSVGLRIEPGASVHPRPGTSPRYGDAPGPIMAGSWTSTGWPDTMESAVLSGEAAATRILAGTSVGWERVE